MKNARVSLHFLQVRRKIRRNRRNCAGFAGNYAKIVAICAEIAPFTRESEKFTPVLGIEKGCGGKKGTVANATNLSSVGNEAVGSRQKNKKTVRYQV
jgi:hypothetical protein